MSGNDAGRRGSQYEGEALRFPLWAIGTHFYQDFLRIAQSALWSCLLAGCEPGAFIHQLPFPTG